MSVSVGDKLGPYEILASIGAGGMGEVWKARDTRLNREVAIKFSQAQFSDRFQREANTIASLNHPNICTLYDVGPNYLVMELIEGTALADRTKEGPIPMEEALGIARQIADALEAAHEKNIVHRDLKPGNIKVRPDGSVKVLDFGLARAGAEAPVTSDSPTVTQSPTQFGVILGTAAYMAPEQARGKVVDKRADIWAFGVVLYEMLTGKPLFEGEDLTDTLASVVKSNPDLTPVPKKVRRLLEACLQKDPKKRLRDIGDYGLLLQDQPAEAQAQTTVPAAGMNRIWVAAAAALALIPAGLAFVHFRENPLAAHVISSSLLPPEGTEFNFAGGVDLPAVSPDGTRIVFGAVSKDSKWFLYVRRLDSSTAQPLQGSEDAVGPFWSPDSRWVAFAQQGLLKKIDTRGGPPVTLGNAHQDYRGGSWSPAGIILFSSGGAIMRISAAGGTATEVVPSANGGDMFPWFLPDGRHFLYSHRVEGDIPLEVASIDEPGKPGKVVAQVHSNAAYAQGHLLYLRDQTLMAQPFNTDRLATTGEAVAIAEGVPTVTSPSRLAVLTVSAGGLLVHASSPGLGGSQLIWKDRQGKTVGTLGQAKGAVRDVALSPDGKQLALSIRNPNLGDEIWIVDTERGIPKRFTSGRFPVWSPDGRTIYWILRGGLHRGVSDGSAQGETLLLSDDGGKSPKLPTSISPDGQLLLYFDPVSTKSQISVASVASAKAGGNAEPRVFLNSDFPEWGGVFRPDGHWVAYVSRESGRAEIYIAQFPGPGGKKPVSSGGGREPQWRRDGKELFYQSLTGDLMAAEVIDKGGVPEIGKTQKLFGGLTASLRGAWAASADGRKFVVAADPEGGAARPLTLVQNWTSLLNRISAP